VTDRFVAVFDFDQTLSTRDNVIPFIGAAVGRARLAWAMLTISPLLAAAVVDDGRRDAAKVALVRRTLTGYDATRLATIADGFADDVVAHHLRPDVVDRVGWHRDQDHELVIVSASFTTYLIPIAARLGGFGAVLATELAVGDDRRLTGELTGPNVRGAEKVHRLDEWLQRDGRPAFVWAYGDSSGDRELLERADQGITVGRRARVAS
jgi:phosphatidylglycerophosphatase C